MCLVLEEIWVRLINILIGMYNQFVYVPWVLCSRGPCTWWCLCCNKWLCWSTLILVFILTVFFWIMLATTITVALLLCETLCIFSAIGPGRSPGCFGGHGQGTPVEPPPTPSFPTPTNPPSPPTKPT